MNQPGIIDHNSINQLIINRMIYAVNRMTVERNSYIATIESFEGISPNSKFLQNFEEDKYELDRNFTEDESIIILTYLVRITKQLIDFQEIIGTLTSRNYELYQQRFILFFGLHEKCLPLLKDILYKEFPLYRETKDGYEPINNKY